MSKIAPMVRQTHAEWLAEAKARFGRHDGLTTDMAFVCPRCGNVATVRQFVERGLEPGQAALNCLGRFAKEIGCDWAAYGLFGTLGKGRFVSMSDGSEVQVFDFAPARQEGSGKAQSDA